MKDPKRNIDQAASAWFEKVYDRVLKIEYNHNWATTDTLKAYQGAVHGRYAPNIAIGNVVRSESPMGRKLLLMGTELGNVVVFTPFLYTHEVLFANASETMKTFTRNDILKDRQRGGVFNKPVKNELIKLLFGTPRQDKITRLFASAPEALTDAFLEQYEKELTKLNQKGVVK